jgi:hypothetical protein
MNRRLPSSVAPWIAGTLVAATGVSLARLVAPQLDDPARSGLTVVGQLLGVAGLFLIAWGVRRRLRAPLPGPEPAPLVDPIAPRNHTP